MLLNEPQQNDPLERAREVLARVQADLLALPGVQGVDVGQRLVDGRKTDEIAIRVYVRHKRDVPEEELIPRMIEGIPTDVIERRFTLHADS